VITDPQGSLRTRKLLSARDASLEITGLSGGQPTSSSPGQPDASSVSPGTAFADFLKLGVEHIWTGYDHLLFLLALLVVCRGVRSMLAIVTCFTLAHSLTLAAATLDWFILPSRWVEPLIAASIVFVGAENLIRRGAEPKGRWALTFGFGLIHGFGFASVLRDLGVGAGSGGVVLPLLSFNLGVELGQVAIALATLPILWKLRSNSAFLRFGVPSLSSLTVAAGLFWLLQRTLFA
jgi:hydrogenase/urease accessory protein HupE